MVNFTLKQLRYFEALCKHGHFGRAAEACAISQPALSVQIKELEAAVGTPLFERGPKHVQPTGFGLDFAQRVHVILQSVDDLGEMARASRDSLAGRLRIGIIPTIAPYLLPTIFRNLGQSHAGLDIRVRESLTQKLLAELDQGKLDTAIVALPVSEPSLHEIALFEENFVLVRPASDANAPAPDASGLREMRLLLLEEGHCFRDQALSFCNLSSTVPHEGLDGSSLTTLVQMVGAGVGVTLIPQMAIGVETRSANVAITRLRGAQPSRTVGMVWRKTSPLAEQLTQIAEVVRASAVNVQPPS